MPLSMTSGIIILGALLLLTCCGGDNRIPYQQLRPPEEYEVQSPSTDPGKDSSLYAALPSSANAVLRELEHNVLKSYPARNMIPAQRRDVSVSSVAKMLKILRSRGNNFASNGPPESKFVGLCYHWSLLATSVLRSRGYACRVRCGFAPYLGRDQMGVDHTVIELWNPDEEQWQLIDPELISMKPEESMERLHISSPMDPFHLTENQFHLAATAWINYRNGKIPEFYYGLEGNEPSYGFVRTSLIRDWLNILCYEQTVSFDPELNIPNGMSEMDFLDSVALLMLNPDDNFDRLNELSMRIGSK
jgi:hypothetical protein